MASLKTGPTLYPYMVFHGMVGHCLVTNKVFISHMTVRKELAPQDSGDSL